MTNLKAYRHAASVILMAKLSHKKFRNLLKKFRRKRVRQIKAKTRDVEEKKKLEILQSSPSYVQKQAELDAAEELQRENEEKERELLHQEWLRREAVAQLKFMKRKETEERIRKEKEEETKRLQEEWEILQQKEKEEADLREAALRSKKEKEAALLKQATDPLLQGNGPWHNPTPPENFGTEKDKQNCPFFIKTGACRFGDRCSRGHPKPNLTCTLLIPGMFSHFSIDQAVRDEYDSDISLEYEDSDFYLHFKEFYEDVLPEFKKLGRVVQFKVCRNYEPHLRGNVYVQFEREEDALEAFKTFNGRWYAGKQLSCEFTLVTKWKSAICGLYHRNRCPKGKACNFLHVFQNPNSEFLDADRDCSPKRMSENRSLRAHSRSPSRSRRSSTRSYRSPRSQRHSNSYLSSHRSRHSLKRHRRRSRDRSNRGSSSDSLSSGEDFKSRRKHRPDKRPKNGRNPPSQRSTDTSTPRYSVDDEKQEVTNGHHDHDSNTNDRTSDVADTRGTSSYLTADETKRQKSLRHGHSKSKHRKHKSKSKKKSKRSSASSDSLSNS